jgi:hypothetical protein
MEKRNRMPMGGEIFSKIAKNFLLLGKEFLA